MFLPFWKTLFITLIASISAAASQLSADDGYRLWLKYPPLEDAAARQNWAHNLGKLELFGHSDTLDIVSEEIRLGLKGLFGEKVFEGPASILIGTLNSLPETIGSQMRSEVESMHPEGYLITRLQNDEAIKWVITSKSDVGVLYGAFAFLRSIQSGSLTPESQATLSSQPRIQHRLLNHWDNLTRTIERVQSGQSIWEWYQLPDYVSPRYRDYARANASIGINGTVLTNVNANALVLTTEYLHKASAIADVLRPYGIRVYLTARFSAPIEIGGLGTADPLDPDVINWWNQKTDEIYSIIPDFGGFLVKANSEGQPGPQEYGRNHADGANMLADAVGRYDGIVMWRAFVYTHEDNTDRHKQAYNEFVPMDGEFRDNVIIQTKNGPIDFMPREPFHPMFGAMPKTAIGLELQITQEYLGGAIHLAFLAPLFEEVLDSDTFQQGEGTTVAGVIEGRFSDVEHTVIAGVSNIGTDRNWTGHPLLQSNWYAFGRLAWDSQLSSDQIADEWIRQTFSADPKGSILKNLKSILLESREAVVNYSMPLGLHHIMAMGHHIGPGPWVNTGRADWTSPYYHRADAVGLGFDRTATGSNALEQYSPTIQQKWSDPATIPTQLLLWFHHIPWEYEMSCGDTLWESLGSHYQKGVDSVRNWQQDWASLEDSLDPQTFSHVTALLARQEREAVEYKDACLTYFQTFSNKPWPSGAEPAAHDLDYYKSIVRHHVPGDPSEQ